MTIQYIERAAPFALDPAIAQLGNEREGLAIDGISVRGYVRDRTTPSNFFLGDLNDLLTYSSPSTKWITNGLGQLVSGTTMRCDHDPATRDTSSTALVSFTAPGGLSRAITIDGATVYSAGQIVRLTDAGNINRWMLGKVTAFNAGTKALTVNVYASSGVFSCSSWVVIVALGIRIESQATNLLKKSQCDTGFVGAGTSPPAVASGVTWLGQSSTKITFSTGATVGYAGSRAARIAATAFCEAGKTYRQSIYISLSRPLSGSEALRYYWTGQYGGDTLGINAAESGAYVGAFKRAVVGVTTPGVSGNNYPVVYLDGTLTSDIDVYVMRGQCEEGTIATSYIEVPATTAVTRAADNISLALSKLPALGGAYSMLVCARYDGGSSIGSNSRAALELSDGTNNNRLLVYNGGGGRANQVYSISGGTNDGFVNGPAATADFVKTALRMEANHLGVSHNGAAVSTDTSVTLPVSLTKATFGQSGAGLAQLNGHLTDIVVVPRGWSDAELQTRAAL